MTKTQRFVFSEALRMASKAVLQEEDQDVVPWLYSFSRELAHTVLIHLKHDPISVEKICAAYPNDAVALRTALHGGLPKDQQQN